jgi:3-phosphoshikimate 1-carboxyvinyltransferase
MPDLAQTFAVLATAAQGPCRLRGLHTLRIKETDRISALVNELGSLGIVTQIDADTLTVVPGNITPTRPIRTYHDHRMAMAFAMLASVCPAGIVLEDPGVVVKSYPDYWRHLEQVGFTTRFDTLRFGASA